MGAIRKVLSVCSFGLVNFHSKRERRLKIQEADARANRQAQAEVARLERQKLDLERERMERGLTS